LDSTYVKTFKSPLLIDSDYVISSLRQQMVAAGVELTDNRDEAEIIAEARLGALGLDGHQVTYGLPASNLLNSATSVFTSTPSLPAIPEISLARNEAKTGAAKIAVFAYVRETRERYWQSGISRSSSNAKDSWILGIGPLQRGTIYQGTRFAGEKLDSKNWIESVRSRRKIEKDFRSSDAFADYSRSRLFNEPKGPLVPDEFQIRTAATDEEAETARTAELNDESKVER
jgi:hypothetical protein